MRRTLSFGPLLPPGEAQREWTGAEMSYLQGLRFGAIVGSAAQVRDKLETLAGQLNVDEVVVVTWAWDPQDQLRSYELLAREFGLR